MATKTLLTVEEFLELDLPDDRRYELDEGEVVELTFPSPAHNETVLRIQGLLVEWARHSKIARVYPSDTPFKLDAGTVRGPDAAVVRSERVSQSDRSKPFEGAPDVAIEVVSPSDRRTALHRKVAQFLAAGAAEVWLVNLKTRSVTVLSDTDERTYTGTDVIESPVLPGFRASIAEFFDDPA